MADLLINLHQKNMRKETTSMDKKLTKVPTAEEENDDDDNVLSLKLRKPKHWKWELTTSRSCTNIALPRILLYDQTGELLLDANELTEQIYRQPNQTKHKRGRGCRKRTVQRSSTSLLTPSIRQALDEEFNGLHISDAKPTPSIYPLYLHKPSPTCSTAASSLSLTLLSLQRPPINSILNGGFIGKQLTSRSDSCIDIYTHELSDYQQEQQQNYAQFERRSSSLKGVRFKVDKFDNEPEPIDYVDTVQRQSIFPTPPSTVTTTTITTPTNSSSSGPREKKRYRRMHSSGRLGGKSESILERFSYTKRSFSSPEHAEEQQLDHGPRYYLRTSKAGTLVIQEDSFSRRRHIRRRPKHPSSENMLNESDIVTSERQSLNSLKHPDKICTSYAAQPIQATMTAAFEADSLQNMSQPDHVQHKVRRYLSDENVQLNKQQKQHFSTSETEQELKSARSKCQHRNYNKEMVTINSANRIYRSRQAPTRAN